MSNEERPLRRSWILVTVWSVLIGAYGVAVVASRFTILPDEVAANDFPIALRVHIVTASIALLLGPWQFSGRVRSLWPRAHRMVGRAYVVVALVAATTGAAAALTTANGPVAGAGFLLLGIGWFVSTSQAFIAATRRDVAAHRTWAFRSFSLAFAAVTLRIYLGVSGAAGVDFEDGYPVIAWACWIPNLVVAQWLIGRTGSRRTRPELGVSTSHVVPPRA